MCFILRKSLSKEIRFYVDEELHAALFALAERRGEAVADICRRTLRETVKKETAKDSLSVIDSTVREAMEDVLRPVEERLARINAKTAIAAATAMYTNIEVLGGHMGKDALAIYEAARKKAVGYVKTPNEQLMSDE